MWTLIFKMSLKSLRRHPVRSGLALLGIIIGIAALITTISLGKGAEEKVKEEILAMGKDVITIHQGNFFAHISRSKSKPLTYQDYQAILEQVPGIASCTPCLSDSIEICYQENKITVDIKGFSSEYINLESRSIKLGSSFSLYQCQAGIRVAVLGFDTAKQLFGLKNPIGKIIYIDKHAFKVIGVLNKKKITGSFGFNPDLDVIVPFFSVWKTILEKNIRSINLIPKNSKHSAQIISNLKRILRFRHNLKEDPDDFTILNNQEILKAAEKSSKTFTSFLIIASAASLIVGGIGVMNIMLVSMTERKKEIGLKMAIGASSFQILAQFMLEAIFLCFLGGVIGSVGGVSLAYLSGLLMNQPWALEISLIPVILSTISAIGLFFGFFPAYQASKLNPVEILQ